MPQGVHSTQTAQNPFALSGAHVQRGRGGDATVDVRGPPSRLWDSKSMRPCSGVGYSFHNRVAHPGLCTVSTTHYSRLDGDNSGHGSHDHPFSAHIYQTARTSKSFGPGVGDQRVVACSSQVPSSHGLCTRGVPQRCGAHDTEIMTK